MAERVRIASADLAAEIDPHGAELSRLTTAAGDDLLWDGDPAWWTGRAPLLFPVVGALAGGEYRLDGRRYSLPKHGFARTSRFRCIDRSARAATFRLEDSPETHARYLFAFALDMRFEVDAATLRMTATVTNRDHVPMPFSFGFHPAFRWPLPGGGAKEDHRLLFEREEPAPIRAITAEGLIGDPLPSPVEGRSLALRDELFEHDALVWDRLESRALRFEGGDGRGLAVGFPDTPHLGVWMKPGAGYLCIEPWQGHADPADHAGDFRDKPGVVQVAPGDFARFRMSVTAD